MSDLRHGSGLFLVNQSEQSDLRHGSGLFLVGRNEQSDLRHGSGLFLVGSERAERPPTQKEMSIVGRSELATSDMAVVFFL